MRKGSELVPLLGWAGAGAIDTIWFSLWTQGSGRGAPGTGQAPLSANRERIRGWIGVNRLDLGVNTVLTALLTVGFLLAGAAILQPMGLEFPYLWPTLRLYFLYFFVLQAAAVLNGVSFSL